MNRIHRKVLWFAHDTCRIAPIDYLSYSNTTTKSDAVEMRLFCSRFKTIPFFCVFLIVEFIYQELPQQIFYCPGHALWSVKNYFFRFQTYFLAHGDVYLMCVLFVPRAILGTSVMAGAVCLSSHNQFPEGLTP